MSTIEELERTFGDLANRAGSLDVRVWDLEREVSDSNSHFNSLLNHSRLHAAESLRDLARYPYLLATGPNNASGYIGRIVFYDVTKDALELRQFKGQRSLAEGAQVHPKFPNIIDDVVSIQWESFYDVAGFNGGKSYQISWTPGGDDRLLEIQSSFVPSNLYTGPDYRLLHSIRSYGGGIAGGNGSIELFGSGPIMSPNVQPALWAPLRQRDTLTHIGEGGTAYLVRPGIWTRYTISWDLSIRPARIKFWISDELTDPVLLMADPLDHDLGFIYEPTAENRGVNKFWFEFNNSTTYAPVDLSTWHRNFIVFKGTDVPLGGRPK